MGKTNFVTDKLIEALSWDWQTQEDLYRRLIPMVPPGRALRQYEARSAHNSRAKAGLERAKPPLPESEQIYSGARDIVRDSMWNLVKSGYAERCDVDGQVMLRRRDRRAAAPVQRQEGEVCEACGRPFVIARSKGTEQPRAKVIPLSAFLTKRDRQHREAR